VSCLHRPGSLLCVTWVRDSYTDEQQPALKHVAAVDGAFGMVLWSQHDRQVQEDAPQQPQPPCCASVILSTAALSHMFQGAPGDWR
jgi:hypothetical protein